MGRSQETYNKKEIRNRNEKKRKEKEKKRLAKKEKEKKSSLDDMIAYVDENGQICSTPPDPAKKTEIKTEDIEISTANRKTEQEQDSERKGTVTFFDEAKGFGFIKDYETGEKIFVHINNITGDIREGNTVCFEAEMGQRGFVAVNVRVADTSK